MKLLAAHCASKPCQGPEEASVFAYGICPSDCLAAHGHARLFRKKLPRVFYGCIKILYQPYMAADGVEKLLSDHKVRRSKQHYFIKLNKPPDFVYDISDLEIKYYAETHECSLYCADLPDAIVENILRFQYMDIADFVPWIESNLNTFCMGQLPKDPPRRHAEESSLPVGRSTACAENPATHDNSKPVKLPADYKFPVNSTLTPNVRYEAMKSNILMISCKSISVTLECSRCKTVQEAREAVKCSNCHNEMGMTYLPIHAQEYLGFLGLRQCSFVCFNPCRYQISCSNCGANYETASLGCAASYSFACFDCFTNIKLRVEQIIYQQKVHHDLKIGAELPNKGACKHYKKSLRWFRFSCCNNLYPCDVCHDEANSHRSEEAKRMVCGLCSKEQSVKKECECGMSLKAAQSQFWEGGRGNRDRLTMSKKDSRKHKRR